MCIRDSCIPVYPRLYLWTDPDATIVRTAREANMTMPQYCVDQAASVLGDLSGKKVVVLGASYRGKVKETAFSGVFPTVEILAKAGADVSVHDPMFTDEELGKFGFKVTTSASPSTGPFCRPTIPSTPS